MRKEGRGWIWWVIRAMIRTLSQILLYNLLKSSDNLLCNSQENSFMIFKAKISLSMNFLTNKWWHIFQFKMKKQLFFICNLVTPPAMFFHIPIYTACSPSHTHFDISAFLFWLDVKRNARHVTQISHAVSVSRQPRCWRLKQQTKLF